MKFLKILASNSKDFRIYGIFKKWQIRVPPMTTVSMTTVSGLCFWTQDIQK